MPETDAFYDLADRKGLMVLQEWPTAWNSHREGWQPYALIEETVRRNTLRLRNHPSLVMWGGGNESGDPSGPAIDMMGRLSVELDGTRPFHRGEPWGGSLHNYDCWWGKAGLDRNLTLTGDFIGEFGIASLPDYASVLRYLPEAEQQAWPPPQDGSFAHHTPVFNRKEDMARLAQYAGYFASDSDMKRFIWGSQMAQATGVRHTLERARTRWPHCAGALYYKLNDNYPAASWSSVDWYGVPKRAYYVIQDSFAPLHACVLFDTLHAVGTPLALPVCLLDDADALRDRAWEVRVRAFDASLREIERVAFPGSGAIERVARLGCFRLTDRQTETRPLLIVSEIWQERVLADRTFYWLNFGPDTGDLLALPETDLVLAVADAHHAVVTNRSGVPGVGVQVTSPDHAASFVAGDNVFWLDPGEEKTIRVSHAQGLRLEAWNL
jgi:beta-mannosidase